MPPENYRDPEGANRAILIQVLTVLRKAKT
jgi:hypothetical protein